MSRSPAEDTVARVEDPGHQCLCVLIKQSAVPVVTTVDRCKVYTSPDQPFCTDCEDRHPSAQYDGSVVEVTDIYHLKEGRWANSLENAATSETDGNPSSTASTEG